MKFKVSELFYSIQGEGKYVGVPSVFLRMFGCNFTCGGFGMPRGEVSQERKLVDPVNFKKYNELPLVKTGCDSYASWDPRFKNMSPTYTEQQLCDAMTSILPRGEWDIGRYGSFINGRPLSTHLVITGGEPLLGWQRVYPDLLKLLWQRGLHEVTFETNGSQELTKELRDYLADPRWNTTFSVSPKLSASGERWSEAINPAVVKGYEFPGSNIYLKFVVQDINDFEEVDQAVAEYQKGGVYCPVYVMPVGGTGDLYYKNNTQVAKLAMEHGWRYSPRIQVDLFKNAWGT